MSEKLREFFEKENRVDLFDERNYKNSFNYKENKVGYQDLNFVYLIDRRTMNKFK